MSNQAFPESVQPLAPALPAVKLWSPNFIFAVGFFLGFPAGVILAFLNWRRMNLEAKGGMQAKLDGMMTDVNGSAMTKIKGGIVMIN